MRYNCFDKGLYQKYHNRKAWDALHRRFGNKCTYCGAGPEGLEFAHLKPTELNGRGRSITKKVADIKRHPDSYTLLCKQPCHEDFDAGRIKLEGMPDNRKY